MCDDNKIKESKPTKQNGLWYYNYFGSSPECKGLESIGKPCSDPHAESVEDDAWGNTLIGKSNAVCASWTLN